MAIATAFYHLYLSPLWLLPRDNFSIHYRLFEYIGLHWRHLGEFPSWSYRHGLPLAPLANNHIVLAPYRWVGYWLIKTFGIAPALAYKICFLWVGQGLFWLGVWCFFRAHYRSSKTAWLAVTLGVLSPLHYAVYHQEQAFGTVFFLPWIALCVIRLNTSLLAWPALGSLLGLALNVHYPQLILLTCAFAGISALAFLRPRLSQTLRAARSFGTGRVLTLASLGFLCSAAPVLYSYFVHAADLKSPYRDQNDSVFAQNFKDYETLNRLGPSSVEPQNLRLLLSGPSAPPRKTVGDMDALTLLVGWGFPLVIVLGVWASGAYLRFLLALGALLLLAATGIHGPLPAWLFPWFPGITLFRQWYHFLPIFHFVALLWSLHVLRSSLNRFPRWALSALLAFLVVDGLLASKRAAIAVVGRLLPVSSLEVAPTEAAEFTHWIWFRFASEPPLAIPKSIDLRGVVNDLKAGLPLWTPKQGNSRVVSPRELRIDPEHNGFSLALSGVREGGVLTVLQAYHRDWRSLTGQDLLLSRSGLLQVRFAPDNAKTSTVRLRAEEPLWLLSLVLSGLPLALLGLLLLSRKMQEGRSESPRPVLET